jgi:hypothetical protein
MPRPLFALVVALMMAGASPVLAVPPPAAVAHTPDETAVLAADARQRAVVADIDLEGIAAIAHPNLRVNAPNNRILTREDLIAMVRSGAIRNEAFERTPEMVVITGDVGVVMGREVVYPGAASEQAQMYGRKTLNRRYTNVYLREGGVWRHLARHANVVPAAE